MSTVGPINKDELTLALMDDIELIALVNTNPGATTLELELADRLFAALKGHNTPVDITNTPEDTHEFDP